MGEVVKFSVVEPQPVEAVEYVWECICGNTEFFLHEDGDAECGSCGTVSAIVRCFATDESTMP